MYVTRRLLRSTLEETMGAVKQEPTDAASEEADAILSPRKRRPLLQTQATKQSTQHKSNKSSTPTPRSASKSKSCGISPKQAENQGDKRNKASGSKPALRGRGMLIDARDSKERWCEAKILDLNLADESVFIHYVGWNTRYDCWLEAKFVAAHGSHTGAKRAPNSWNGKDSLFSDPAAPNKPAKASGAKTTTTPTKLVVASSTNNKKKKKRPANDDESNNNTSKDDDIPKASKRTSQRAATVKVEVAVDTVDDDSDRKTRRGSRREKIDLELEMDVCGEATPVKKEEVAVPPPAKRTRTSPTAKPTRERPAAITTKAKSPTAATRKPSPRVSGTGEQQEAKTDSDETPASTQLQSPTVGMSALRRSARAALVAKKASTKKRKSEEDDSDEEYKEEDEEDEEDEEEDDDEDEVDESDDDLPVRRSSSSSGKARRVSSSSSSGPRRSGNAVITQWQTNPAYYATREHLSTIFRHRLQQRGELDADFHGSFQQAMSGSSAASTPRSAHGEASESKEEKVKGPKKKKAKTAQRVMSDEEKAAAAQYYYAQHYYHMQAYQYHQYMYQQALVAQQLEQQRLAEKKATDGDAETKSGDEASEGGDAEKKSAGDEEKPQAEAGATAPGTATEPSPTTQAPIMNGGIIDPRFIHARMDALEHQKRMQLYYQHYNQATERNLQILAASPEYLHTGAALWREQVHTSHQLPGEQKLASADGSVAATVKSIDVGATSVEEKRPVDAVESPPTKRDEGRQVENASQGLPTEPQSAVSGVTTPEATPEAVEGAASASGSCSPRSPDGQADGPSTEEKPGSAQSSPSEDQTTVAKPEAVLFELAL